VTTINCLDCGKPNESVYFCDWDCHVAYAKKQGGIEHAPNGLPIKCIAADWSMWEHEHGDHPDYKFPVDIDYVGPVTDGHREDAVHVYAMDPTSSDDAVREAFGETHALIYTDGSIAITIHECTYAMWYLRDGECGGGSLYKSGDWKLSMSALEYIRKGSRR